MTVLPMSIEPSDELPSSAWPQDLPADCLARQAGADSGISAMIALVLEGQPTRDEAVPRGGGADADIRVLSQPVRATRRMATILANWTAGDSSTTEAVLGLIRATFQSRGWSVEMVRLPPGRLAGDCALFVREARGLVVAVGGDGTVSAVAAACRLHRRAFGVIPTGAYNHFARSLGLPADPVAAVDALVASEPVTIPYGQINGRVFLDNASMGLYPWLVSQRDRDRNRNGAGRRGMDALASGLFAMVRPSPTFELAIELDGIEQVITTSTAAFSVTAPCPPGADATAAHCVRDGQLAVTSLALHTRLDMLGALGPAVAGQLGAATTIRSCCARRVRVASGQRRIAVAIDGEATLLEPPLELRLRDSGLQLVMAPPSAT